MNILFIAGPGRSGTTALTEYLNDHPKVLVCQERYKWVPKKLVSPELFTFERILEFEEDYEKRDIEERCKYHSELISRKDSTELEWIGDKFPNYVENLYLLAENNPGASFIFTYRPIEEVAESFEARSRDPNDGWLGGRDGFRLGIRNWNKSLRKVRGFIESGVNPNALVISYDNFFYYNEECVPLLSRFLGLEFDESVRSSWRERSRSFEGDRREKESLSGSQQSLIREHADREAEAWILKRIQRQWEEFEALQPEAASALIKERRQFAFRMAQERLKSRALRLKVQRLQQRVESLQDKVPES